MMRGGGDMISPTSVIIKEKDMTEEVIEVVEEESVGESVDYSKLRKDELIALLEERDSNGPEVLISEDVEAAEAEFQAEREERGFAGLTMPEQISNWIHASQGIRVSPLSINVIEVDEHKVTYRIQGNSDFAGIKRKSNGELIDPPIHEHEYHYRAVNGVVNRQGGKFCTCGKSEPVPPQAEVPAVSS